MIDSSSREELREFGAAVSVGAIPEQERDMLVDALVPTVPINAHERNRIATYAAILSLSAMDSARISADRLLEAALLPLRPTPPILESIMDGWALFAVRDVLAAAHEAVLAAILGELRTTSTGTGSPVQADGVINALLAESGIHDQTIREIGLLGPDETIETLTFRRLSDRVTAACSTSQTEARGFRFWDGPLNEVLLARRVLKSGAAAVALLPVAWLLAERRADVGALGRRTGFTALSWNGRTRIGLNEIILPQLREFRDRDLPLRQVMGDLARRTVDQHLRTAWARLAVDVRKDVLLLIEDGGLWRRREKRGFRAGRAPSRLDRAIGWIEQLGLTSEGRLTTFGETILRRSLQTLQLEVAS